MNVWILTDEAYHETTILSVHGTEAGGITAWKAARKAMIKKNQGSIQHWRRKQEQEGAHASGYIEHCEAEIKALKAATPYTCHAECHPLLRAYEVKQ